MNKKLSILIEEQFPNYYRENAQNLIDFIKAYYEWLEETGEINHGIENLLNFRQIDSTFDKYIQYFESELLSNIPKNIAVDKRLLAKHIKDLYQTKGTENSFKLLFRILYNEDLEVYLPKENILKVSDGNWIEEKVLRVECSEGTDKVFNMEGLTITGQTSEATAIVESVKKVSASQRIVFDLYISNIFGTFQDQETIKDTNNISANVLGVLSEISIIDGGAFHQKNDRVIISLADNSPAFGKISAIDNRSAIKFVLAGGGSGYRNVGNATIKISQGSGFNASFKIKTISDDESISIATDQIGALAHVPLNAGPNFGSHPNQNGANYSLSANMSSANISSTIENSLNFFTVNTGSITSIETVNYGYDYNDELPLASVIDDAISDLEIPDGSGGIKGRNADIQTQYVNGAIETVSLEIRQTDINYNISNTVNIRNSTRNSTVNATANVITKTGIFNVPGRYQGTKGWLSSDMRLQDNDFYQEYSYELIVRKSLKEYKNIVKNLIHPAGTKMFGKYKSFDEINSNVSYSPVNTNTNPQIYNVVNGFVQVISGNNEISGNSTSFLSEFSNGDSVVINNVNGGLYIIDTVIDNTTMTVKPTPPVSYSGVKIFKTS